MANKKINYNLYLFEFIFAFLVILVHVDFYEQNVVFDALGRSTVLFFFIFSSYFYCKTLEKENFSYKISIKKAFRLLLICFGAYVGYFVLLLPLNIKLYGLPQIFYEFNLENMIDLFNLYFPNASFLWFMLSLAICYLVFPFVYKVKHLFAKKYSIIIPLSILVSVYIFRIIVGVLNNEFSNILFGVEVTRNALFTGLPCFLIGAYLYHHLNDIKKVNNSICLKLFIFFLLTTMVEGIVHHILKSDFNEFYISSIFISCLAVVYSLRTPYTIFGEKVHQLFGSHGPTVIYLSHSFFIVIFETIFFLF